MINNFIIFLPKFYIHLEVFLSSKTPNVTPKKQKIYDIKQYLNITTNCIMKSEFIENLYNFLKTTKNTSKKEKQQVNSFMPKLKMEKLNSKIVTINFFWKQSKKELIILTLAWILKNCVKNIAIIGLNTYHYTCHLKKVNVLVVSISNLKFEAKQKYKSETNLKTIVSKKYHNFLNMFWKKNLDTKFFDPKYNHKIISEENKNITPRFYIRCYLKNLM